jgi:predicted GIY-YIG superfamily endonuclease
MTTIRTNPTLHHRGAGATSVYTYRDTNNLIIYIGITNQGPGRQEQHNKSSAWWQYVASQQVEHYDTRAEAAARERELIRLHRPPFNVVYNVDSSRLRNAYLCLFDPAAFAYASNRWNINGCLYDCSQDDPPCDWEKARNTHRHEGEYCENPLCQICHAKYHGWREGLPDGYEAGQKDAYGEPQDVTW